MMLLPLGAMAQDPVHGVDGYYNYTPTQMKASGQFTIGGNGKKVSGYYPEVRYTDDMKYMIFNMGVNNTTRNDERGGYQFRSEVNLAEVSKGDGAMVMTSAYPVLAFKLSGVYGLSEQQANWGYNEIAISWYNPTSEDGTNPGQTSGNKNKLQLSGLDNNGRFRFYHFQGALKDAFGRDSIYLNNNQGLGSSKYRWLGSVKDENGDAVSYPDPENPGEMKSGEPAWHILRVDPKDGEMSDIIIGLNIKAVRTASGRSFLDSCDIKLSGISFMPIDAFADYEGKSKDELPRIYFKWIKTFESWEAFEASLCDEQSWGDGPAMDPDKAVLNSELYAMRQLINNYKFSAQVETLRAAYDAAAAVYNNAASTSADYQAQVTAMTEAKTAFLAAIAYDNSESKMSTFYSLTGMGLGLTSQDVTVGNYTGRALTLVTPENAANFLLTKNGEVGGQPCYTVQTSSYTMVQASDGQLLFVPATQLSSSSAKANLVMSNRKTADDPGYDFKVGKYFYFYSEEDGEFSTTTEFPTVEDESELTNYLFYPQAALPYDRTDHNETTHAMTSGEGSWCEFNGAVDVVINPAYEASFAKYEWDANQKAVAQERAKQNQFEGWRTNGWRLGTGVESATLENGEKTMKLTWRSEYDQIHNDSINAAIAVTDWANDQIVTIMREHGDYNKATDKAPNNNQTCDSLWAVNMNAGINRYFAMKWKANTDEIELNGLTFFVRKNIEEPGVGMSTLLEKRGDIYVWDLLDCGIPYGDRKACAQYLSWKNVKAADEAVFVDWMRFYENLADIPTESMTVPAPSGISTVSTDADAQLRFYDLNGRTLGSTRPAKQGVYIMQQGKRTMKVVVR